MFARNGYADATAEAIAREAGMSKATFYEHFGNKEECILALFDAAIDVVIEAIAAAAREHGGDTPQGRVGACDARVPRGRRRLPRRGADAARRDHRRRPARRGAPRHRLSRVAEFIDEANQADAEAGLVDRFASPHDAFAIVGAIVELASRQMRTQEPADIRELEPVLERLVLGLVGAAPPRGARLEQPAGPRRRGGGHRVPGLPAPRGVARDGRAREARRIPRLDYWGRPIPGFGDPPRAC